MRVFLARTSEDGRSPQAKIGRASKKLISEMALAYTRRTVVFGLIILQQPSVCLAYGNCFSENQSGAGTVAAVSAFPEAAYRPGILLLPKP